MDKTTERARAWHRYRTRKHGIYVPPGLEGCFSAGWEAGFAAGRELEREMIQAALTDYGPTEGE